MILEPIQRKSLRLLPGQISLPKTNKTSREISNKPEIELNKSSNQNK